MNVSIVSVPGSATRVFLAMGFPFGVLIGLIGENVIAGLIAGACFGALNAWMLGAVRIRTER